MAKQKPEPQRVIIEIQKPVAEDASASAKPSGLGRRDFLVAGLAAAFTVGTGRIASHFTEADQLAKARATSATAYLPSEKQAIEQSLWAQTRDVKHLNNYICAIAYSGNYQQAQESFQTSSHEFAACSLGQQMTVTGNALMTTYVATAHSVGMTGNRSNAMTRELRSIYNKLVSLVERFESSSFNFCENGWMQLYKRCADENEPLIVAPYGALMRGALALGDLDAYFYHYRKECAQPLAYLSAVAGHVGLVRLSQGETVAGLDALDLMINRGQPESSMCHFTPIREVFSNLDSSAITRSIDADFSPQANSHVAQHYYACSLADLVFTSNLRGNCTRDKRITRAFLAYGELVRHAHAKTGRIPNSMSASLDQTLLRMQALA